MLVSASGCWRKLVVKIKNGVPSDVVWRESLQCVWRCAYVNFSRASRLIYTDSIFKINLSRCMNLCWPIYILFFKKQNFVETKSSRCIESLDLHHQLTSFPSQVIHDNKYLSFIQFKFWVCSKLKFESQLIWSDNFISRTTIHKNRVT